MSKFNLMQETDINLHGTLFKAGFQKGHSQL